MGLLPHNIGTMWSLAVDCMTGACIGGVDPIKPRLCASCWRYTAKSEIDPTFQISRYQPGFYPNTLPKTNRLAGEKQKAFCPNTLSRHSKHFCDLNTHFSYLGKKFLFNLSFAPFYQSTQPSDYRYIFWKKKQQKNKWYGRDTISVISVEDCCWFPDNFQA